MKKILAFGFVLTIFSCQPPQDDRATAVCECHKLLHRVDPVNEPDLLNYLTDSCKTLYKGVLLEIENDPEEKLKFDEAFEFCQNEK